MTEWVENVSIARRLAITFIITLILSITAIGVGIYRLNKVDESTKTMISGSLTTERLISDWYRNVHTGIRRATAIAKSNDPSLPVYFAEEAAASSKQSGELQKAVEPRLETDEERALFAEIGELRKVYLSSRDQIAALKKQGNNDEANQVLDQKFAPTAKVYLEKMEKLLAIQRKEIDGISNGISEVNSSSRTLMIVLAVLCLLLSATFSWMLSKTITNPIDKANDLAHNIANGDLTAHISSGGRNELGQLLRNLDAMQGSLIRLVTRVRDGSSNVAMASAEISQGNNDLSSRTEQQAATIEETSSNMEELIANVNKNSESANVANKLAQDAAKVALEGGEVVSQVVSTMQGIHTSSSKISEIISVIDGIAFQTNILALNAAVEAARAGEQGRGFAVVASEVRSLAGRSAQAAKEISQLISDSVEQVGKGTRLVDKAGSTMTNVVDSINKVTEIMGEISAASAQQSLDVAQVGKAVVYMDQVTQQNSALVEEMAAAAMTLKDQADELVGIVDVFKINSSDNAMMHDVLRIR
ncbi:methyl-accepting chemotaxis protein [Sapientia aquatica]|uniref:HAMP domain-containing protein n=1 Tax=Sapientia aquatica TaxID=1549640 RepID=A0A4R5W633_9BURK|nr:methyl-accepting chemotaxis protein [Sapientia aquatica]TDK68557.1 HAMP domain-containing protein [Sapientia aquatica]